MDVRLNLPQGLTARSAEPDDAPAVFELYAAHEEEVQGQADIQLEDIVVDWRRPSFDLGADTVLVLDGDRLLAEAEVFKGRRAEASVHPEAHGRGIGTALLTWTERRAREAGSALVGQTVVDSNTTAVALFRDHGYGSMWRSWVLSIELDGPAPAPPTLPEVYALRVFETGRDDREVYEVVERAFNEWPDRDPYAYEDWRAHIVEAEGFDPSMQLVIEREGTIVATANLADSGAEGWVHQLAVAREHRGLGLGRALLQRSFELFHGRGKSSVRLSTDSRTGALGLYERVGMRLVRSYTHHAKEL